MAEREDSLTQFFLREQEHATTLLDGWSAGASADHRGAYLQLLIRDLTALDMVRSESLREALRHLDQQSSRIERLDSLMNRRAELLAALEQVVDGVGPRDVLLHDPDKVKGIIEDLRRNVGQYDELERRDVLTYLEENLDDEGQRDVVAKARHAADRPLTRPRPGRRPADERSGAVKAGEKVSDWVRDLFSRPDRVLRAKGKEAPAPSRDDRVADEQSEESFPASDAPSSWAGP